jgi:coenzyme Q-binding protein COQ10
LRQRIARKLPWSAASLFDLAADVERYPEFLPWWIDARIVGRDANAYDTDQLLGLGPLRVRFRSTTRLRRPHAIEVRSAAWPFREFRLSWRFEPQPAGDCRVTLAAEIDFRAQLLEWLMADMAPAAITDIVAAFQARARQLYGNGVDHERRRPG